MKKILFILSIIAYVFVSSCADIQFGDGAFSNVPEQDGATIDSMFNSTYNSNRVLATAYYYLPYGIPTDDDDKLGDAALESITDFMVTYTGGVANGPNLYYNGTLNSAHTYTGEEAFRYGAENGYYAIRYAYYYLENYEKIPDIDASTLANRIAEAKLVIAISYAEMLRYVGGVQLIDHVVATSEDMDFPRMTFEETVNHIIDLIDEAYDDLPWSYSDLLIDGGRFTKGSALGLKLRLLLFAASPTFNSNTLWHSEADEYTCYTNYSEDRWKAAYEVGYEIFESGDMLSYHSLEQATTQDHEGYCAAFRLAYLKPGSTESVISIRKSADYGYHSGLRSEFYSGQTLNYVNLFDWADGTPFDADNFEWESVDYFTAGDNLNITPPFYEYDAENEAIGDPTRDPRLYETVAVPGTMYETLSLVDTYKNSLTYSGFANKTDFSSYKFVMESVTARTEHLPHWPYIRLAELYLSYAEILNEYKNDQTSALVYVNAIRNRVGLSDAPTGMTQSEMRSYILDERAKEFGMEEVRWFDLVRHGLEEEFTKTLYGLDSYGLAGADSALEAVNPTHFSYSPAELNMVRYWVTNFDTKWYLAPIPATEINLGYGMTQNPGW